MCRGLQKIDRHLADISFECVFSEISLLYIEEISPGLLLLFAEYTTTIG